MFNAKLKHNKEVSSGAETYSIHVNVGKNYVGVMEQDLLTRRNEHMHAVRQKDFNQSALANHAVLHCNQGTEWNSVKKLGSPKGKRKKYLLEAIKIYKQETRGLALNKKKMFHTN